MEKDNAGNVINWRYYWQIVYKKLPGLLIVSAVVGGAVFGVVRNQGPVYEAHFSYLVSLKEREESKDYSYDGYYALQATDLFAATLAQWIRTPEAVVKTRERAGLKVNKDPRSISRSVRAVKTAPQLIEVTVEDRDRQVVEKMVVGVQGVVDDMVGRYHEEGDVELEFSVVSTDCWVGERSLSAAGIAVAVFVFTIFLAINVVLIRAI